MTDPAAPGPTTSEPAPARRSPLSDGEWHRMHPLTPLLRGGLFIVVVIGIVVANLRERLIEWLLPIISPRLPDGEVPPDPVEYVFENGYVLPVLLGVLATLVLLLVIFGLSWRFHTFRITGDDVEVRSGVLFRTHRRAPLDRVQGVNLTRPLVARLFGLAKLEVVGAGADANVKLEYLTTTSSETVRDDILRLASGRRLEEAARAGAAEGASPGSRIQQARSIVTAGVTGIIDGDDQDTDAPESVVHLPPVRLVLSSILSGSTLILLVFVGVVVFGAVTATPWILLTFIPAVLAFGAYAVNALLKALRYSIAPVPSGVRLTFGLFTTITEIVPPGRVHAVEVKQSPLWRPFGWWSITVNRMSGRASTDSTRDQFTTVLPVGTRDDVEAVLRLLLPGLPEDEWPLVFDAGILGPGDDDPYTTTPRRARWLRPLSWRRNGVLLTRDALFLRRGFLWRSLAVLPLARMQSVALHQGPIDRSLSLANLTANVVAGAVTTRIGILDRDELLTTFDAAATGIVAAAAGDRSHRWAG